jgi:hypothetical protein
MTGTAAGVGAFRSPKSWLQNGDVVEIEVESIGVFATQSASKSELHHHPITTYVAMRTLHKKLLKRGWLMSQWISLALWRRLYIVVQNVAFRLLT